MSYIELNEKSNQLARKLNCEKEEFIGILLEPSIETIISILAVLKSGGAYVPILPYFPDDRINYMISDTKLKKMIVASDYNNNNKIEVIDLRQFNYNEFDGSNLELDIQENNLAYVIYTSGSTGKPKGVLIEHKNVINTCNDHQPIYTIENKDTCNSILFSSFTWDVSVCEIFTNLFNGNTIYILSEKMKKDMNELYKYINTNNIEVCYFPPSLLGLIPYKEDCCIKKIIFAGEKCDNKIGLIWAKRVKLYNYYGPAEATIYATGKQVDSNNVNEIGKPIKNMNAYIVDKDMNLVKIGEKGELLLSGKGIARGYLNLPELTKLSFIPNPFGEGIVYKTGDMVCLNNRNDIEFGGRVDEQVNIRGKRVELNEINETILSCNFIDNSVIKCKTNDDNINEYLYCNYTIKEDKSIINKISIEIVNNWKGLYNKEQQNITQNELYDFGVWKSSETGNLIPLNEMNDWLNNTVNDIDYPKNKNKVLEIGMGTGLIFFKLLENNKLQEYVSCELSQVTIDSVVNKCNTNISTNFINCPAHEIFQHLNVEKYKNYFDLIIINSVIQYFPHISYFLNIIENLNTYLTPDGTIFLGDILNNNFVKKDRELLVSNNFFQSNQYFTCINGKTEDNKNEMTRHRYNVNIKYNLNKINNTDFEPICIDNIKENYNNIKILNIQDSRKTDDFNIEYNQIVSLLNKYNYYFIVKLTDKYEVIDIYASKEENNLFIYEKYDKQCDIKLCNNPIINELEITYNNKIINYLKEKLPEYMIPQYFILLDKFQLNASGKIDQDKLKEPHFIENDYTGELISNEKYILVNTIINKINNTTISYQPDNNLNLLGIDSLKIIRLLYELNNNNYTIEVDVILKCKTINDVIDSLTMIKENVNDAEDLYKIFVKKNGNIDELNLDMNINSNTYQIIKYFDTNFYVSNDNNACEMNCINNLQNINNELIYNIGYNGSCQLSTITHMLSLFYYNPFIRISNSSIGSNSGQGNILNLVQNIDDAKLKKIKLSTNNVLNEFSFPSLDNFDIIILTSDSILSYKKYKHIDTNIEFITRETELIESNVDLKKFEIHDLLTAKELELCINKLILKYPLKKFIFINCHYNDTIDHCKTLREEYNDVYQSFITRKNIYVLDVNKCNNYDSSRYSRWWTIPILDVLKITNNLDIIINDIIKNDGNNLKISKFFKENILYSYDNCKINYLNEGNNYLTNVIFINDKINDKINSIGLSWELSNKFLITNNREIKPSDLSNTSYKKLYSSIPILKCKLIFHARTDKYYKNLRFKIYTGIKWVIIEKEISTEYQIFVLETDFDYSKKSRPRIGFSNIEPNMIIFINNPYFDI